MRTRVRCVAYAHAHAHARTTYVLVHLGAAVAAVFVAGCVVFLNGQPTEVLGSQRTGSFLRANARTTAARRAAEPVSAAT